MTQKTGERVTGAGVLRQEIREALGRGAVVVTANERAAREVRQGWDEWVRSTGEERWKTATALSWASWTASLWRRLLLKGKARALLLNRFQEHAVWRGVLTEDTETQGLRGIEGLAGMASEAWARLWAYAGPGVRRSGVSGLLRGDVGRDAAAFARWAGAFERRCRAEGLLSAAELDARLAEAIRAGEMRGEMRELLLVGFDRLTPLQEHLVAELRRAGVMVGVAESGVPGNRRVVTAATDEAEELRACARWAVRAIERDATARVAVIVPDMAGERAGMERVFREVLSPELVQIEEREGAAPFEFSLGRSLAEMPLVAIALELLRWVAAPLPLERVSGLMVSGYFAGGGEEGERAEFDAYELRKAGLLRPEMSLAGTARLVEGSRRMARLGGLRGAVRRMERMAAEFQAILQGYGAWAEGFRALLVAAGWGPAGTETSEEFQIRQRWEGALDTMATLDFEGRAVEYAEAVATIERIAKATIFAPESRGAPVQVMGPLEAAGGEFDAVWLLRAGELSWPPETRAVALLGWGLQRELGMPGTDAGRDMAAAHAMTERVLASGREVVVSYPAVSGETRQRASAAVRGLGTEEVSLEEIAGGAPERVVVEMECVEDAGVSAPLPEGPVHGGARVLELQAACGFRAFAEHRLASTELERRGLGMDARESGTAVHRALECFWEEVGSQAALLAMTYTEEQAAAARAINEALRRPEQRSEGPWDAAYVATQRERLRRLLSGWLEVEKERPAFTVMQREGEMRDAQVGPLRLKLRMDRVDIVDETQVLIDYKTGRATPGDWLGERPDSPQVPLYAILAARADGPDEGDPLPLGAVAFGRVRAGKEMGLKGFGSREGLLPGKLPRMEAGSFEAQVELWGSRLEVLAEGFAAGGAEVRPKNYPGTCQRCGQRILCRLDASKLEEMEEDEEREGADG